ncbi:hypothetical protein SEVIR_4G051601v4 [Setaria viridis]
MEGCRSTASSTAMSVWRLLAGDHVIARPRRPRRRARVMCPGLGGVWRSGVGSVPAGRGSRHGAFLLWAARSRNERAAARSHQGIGGSCFILEERSESSTISIIRDVKSETGLAPPNQAARSHEQTDTPRRCPDATPIRSPIP